MQFLTGWLRTPALTLFLTLGVLLSFFASAQAQKLVLTWKNNADVYDGVSIERTVPNSFFAEIGTVPPGVATWEDTKVEYGYTYTYRIRAYNQGLYSDYSNSAIGSPQRPLPVGDMAALALLSSVVDPTQNLVLWYKFDNNANDSSGNNRTGIPAGAATYAAGKVGQALSLLGTDGRIRSPLAISSIASTFMLWTFRKGPGAGNLGRMFDKRTTGAEVEVLYNDEAARTYCYLRVGSTGAGSWTIPQPSLNEWHHIAVIYDSSSLENDPQFYVDGILTGSIRTLGPSGVLSTNADPYVIGNRGAGDRGWNGLLDDFRVYNRALTMTEIQSEM